MPSLDDIRENCREIDLAEFREYLVICTKHLPEPTPLIRDTLKLLGMDAVNQLFRNSAVLTRRLAHWKFT